MPKNLKNKVERHSKDKQPLDTHCRKILLQVVILETFKVPFQKINLFLPKNPNFECFENFYYFSRILRQNFYPQQF